MEKKERKVLFRAEAIITKNADDNSVYYNELKKAYKEYKEMELPDKTTKDLYIEHISRLCDFVEERRKSNIIIAIMIFIFLCMVVFTGFSTYKYYNVYHNLKDNIIKANKSTSLIVSYEDINSFNATILGNDDNYMELKPLKINLKAVLDIEDKLNSTVHYDVYIVPNNDELSASDVIAEEAFNYAVTDGKRDSGIKNLGEATKNSNKLLVYSGEINTGETTDVDIRMWIDEKTKVDHLNKKYRFTLYVDGYSY